MMFFSNKPSFVVYLHRDGLTLYSAKAKAVELPLPTDVVQNLEVLDSKKLTEVVAQFAATHNLRRQRGVCILDDWVVFQKIVPKSSDEKQAFTDFESKVPFDPEARATLSVQVKDQIILLGTNKAFFLPVIAAFGQAGGHIVSVTPAAVFGITKTEKLSDDQLQKILNNSKQAERASFVVA